tara:strand:- start:214 stop:1065 length:852 start_codon:yes stop_codon:yes gene_type:complete
MKIAIATCNKVPTLTDSEKLLITLYSQKGIIATPEVWDNPNVKWEAYEVVIIRSVWDYHLYAQLFLNWLNLLKSKGVMVLNDVNLIKENHNKFYLKNLAAKGVSIVPTYYIPSGQPLEMEELDWDKMVIKPAISASSYRTKLFKNEEFEEIKNEYEEWLKTSDYLIQKFIPEIQSFGELSIIFFNRKYSHTILKTATSNEFRVQSDFGGKSQFYEPTNRIIETAERIISMQRGDLLYARIDGTIINEKFVLMEAELIEPELFFDLAPNSINSFVNATLELLEN